MDTGGCGAGGTAHCGSEPAGVGAWRADAGADDLP